MPLGEAEPLVVPDAEAVEVTVVTVVPGEVVVVAFPDEVVTDEEQEEEEEGEEGEEGEEDVPEDVAVAVAVVPDAVAETHAQTAFADASIAKA